MHQLIKLLLGHRRITLILLSVVATALLVVVGRNYHSRHSAKELLERAKAYQGIGQYDKAIEKYQEYLVRKPDATATKLDLASVLVKKEQADQAIELLTIVCRETRMHKSWALYARAYTLLINTYWELGDRVADQGRRELEKKRYESARSKFEKEASYLYERLMLWQMSKRIFSEVDEEDPQPFGALGELIYNSAVSNMVNLALSYWLEGEYEKANETITNSPTLGFAFSYAFRDPDSLSRRYSDFACELSELASKFFKEEDYGSARRHWRAASDNYEKSQSAVAAVEVPRLQYNIAISYYNEGNYWKARELLAKLQDDYPAYEATDVKRLLAQSSQSALIRAALNASEKARKEFDQSNYTGARIQFRQAMEYFARADVPDTSSVIAEIRYNIAMSYWNQKNWSKAKESLVLLVKKHPDYVNEEVQALVDRLVEWGW